MLRAKNLFWALFLIMPFLCLETSASVTDDYTPEVTARVARISFIRGDVQIRRADRQDWERATRDLPLVEGDEIVTDRDARVEIQFDRDSYLRLAEYSYLKVVNLKDEGIALSLPQGTLSLSLLDFDKNEGYFEIDAPSTTIAVQRAGTYRIDAGDERSQDIRVTVTDDGEARVYSTSSGFTLKNGRSARIYIAGNYAGEWEMADASRFEDQFDEWVSDRQAVIVKRLKNAYYDKYYDEDFYGAEELNEHGEWIYARNYGYVWRPYQNALSSYSNWSPYRYGHWRWVAPYGWTWVNDEPWGWATYHHGRWVWTGGYWAWTPYGYYRPRRSWWRPAIVFVASWGNNICWYPLPYNAGYYNYNQYYYNTTIIKNTTVINNTTVVNPTPTPTPVNAAPGGTIPGQMPTRWTANIPPSGVVWTPVSSFGTNTKNFQTPSLAVAQEIITKTPETIKTVPILPTIKDIKNNISSDIVAQAPPKAVKIQQNVKVGATERTTDAPLDTKLQETKIFGNREPVKPTGRDEGVGIGAGGGNGTRKLGAVNRPVVRENNESSGDTKDTPVRPVRPSDNPTTRSTGGGRRDDPEDPPIRNPRNDRKNDPPPVYNPPTRRDEQPPVRVTPRQDEPPNYTPPPPPRRSDPEPPPQQPPTKREDPPPAKSEPKQDDQPPPPVRGKNG